MGLLEQILKYDYLVYWAPKYRNQFGKQMFENPVELSCRWTEGITVVRDQNGQEHIYNGTAFVGQDLDTDGMIWHGRLTDVSVTEGKGDPSVPPADAKLIRRFDKIPNKKYTKFVRKANF